MSVGYAFLLSNGATRTIVDCFEAQMDKRANPTRYRYRRRGDVHWTLGKP